MPRSANSILRQHFSWEVAFDESSNMNQMNIRKKFLIFYTEQAIVGFVETVLQRYLKVLLIKSLNGKLLH